IRRTTGAIFVVTVPATSITSAWRGEKRTTSAPKRLMSNREAPTAMNSIAQQAVPRGNGQRALFRAQFTIALSEVSATFCFSSSGTSSAQSFRPGGCSIVCAIVAVLSGPLGASSADLLAPVGRALAPGVHEADQQDRDKQRHLDQGEAAQPTVGHRPGKDKDGLDVEYRENQRVQVKAGVELHARRALLLDAALVGRELDGIGMARAQKRREQQRYDAKDRGHHQEKKDWPERLQHRPPPRRVVPHTVGSGSPRKRRFAYLAPEAADSQPTKVYHEFRGTTGRQRRGAGVRAHGSRSLPALSRGGSGGLGSGTARPQRDPDAGVRPQRHQRLRVHALPRHE